MSEGFGRSRPAIHQEKEDFPWCSYALMKSLSRHSCPKVDASVGTSRDVFAVFFIFALGSQAPLYAAEQFEGIWAKTQAECLDDERPNSRTLIDLGKVIEGILTPIFDQYEYHCRIERKSVVGNRTNLSVTCFEFWENFTKGIEGQKATIRLSQAQKSALKIDGTPYRRCAKGK